MSTSLELQDLFISHASADNKQYVQPLAEALRARDVSYLLDSEISTWGDSFPSLINAWLKNSRYTLLCLSHNFLTRSWTRTELDAELARQNRDGKKRLLPLILNAKDEVLDTLPIIGNLVYREFDEGVDVIADGLYGLVKAMTPPSTLLRIVIESVHTDKLCYLKVSPRESVSSLTLKAQKITGVKEEADFGTAIPFRIRWVLVDAKAEDAWAALGLEEQQRVRAVVKAGEEVKFSYLGHEDRLEEIGIYDGIVFHLRGIDNNPRLGTRGTFGGGGITASRDGGFGFGGGIVYKNL